MKANGLNLIWPAMHEGGYEFSARPENLELARHWGIMVGTSHCEPTAHNRWSSQMQCIVALCGGNGIIASLWIIGQRAEKSARPCLGRGNASS